MKAFRIEGVKWMVLVAVLALAWGCDGGGGGDEDTGVDTVGDTGTGDTDIVEDVADVLDDDGGLDTAADPDLDTIEEDGVLPGDCSALHAGTNAGFMVDGEAREFILTLPSGAETDGPWPVVFGWHGLGDTAPNFNNLLAPFVNNTQMPFISVVPVGTGVPIFGGLLVLDWDVVVVVAETNKDARLFDEVLACLDERWGVDPDHIHTVGFSLGGMYTDALATIRGEQIASVATYSGGYGNDPANLALVPALGAIADWPEFTVTNKYAQILLHGGATDTYNMAIVTIPFGTVAVNDAAFLNTNGHDVVICDHGGGHSVPSDMYTEKILEFFADHPLGTDASPYRTSGLPSDFASYCAFQPAP